MIAYHPKSRMSSSADNAAHQCATVCLVPHTMAPLHFAAVCLVSSATARSVRCLCIIRGVVMPPHQPRRPPACCLQREQPRQPNSHADTSPPAHFWSCWPPPFLPLCENIWGSMCGTTPASAITTSCSSLLSSSSLRTASWMWRGVMRLALKSRATLPEAAAKSMTRWCDQAVCFT